jgi:integrase
MSTATRITSYQEGCIERVKRAKGPDVWVFRWREVNEDGRRVQRKQVIGGLDRYPTKSDAKRAVENLRAEINARHRRIGVTTVAEAWGHFENCELRDPEVDRCQSTIDNYLVLFKAHIIPRWGNTPLDEVEAVDVERWLRGLKSTFRPGSNSTLPKTEPRPLAPASKAKIKSRMYSLYEHARRHKLCDVNPIETVRQGAKRVNKPAVLTLEEIRTMMLEIPHPAIRLAVLVAGVTGLRRSEVRGLKWRDIDFETHWIKPTQDVVRKHVTSLKTRASGEAIPIPEALSEAFRAWRKESLYPCDEDWVFASPAGAGRSPYWFDSALARRLRPAAKRAGITKKIGWHTFRRSLATLLTSKKETVKVVQELLRHADPRITMELYAQGEEQAKRAAQEHVSGLFLMEKKAS